MEQNTKIYNGLANGQLKNLIYVIIETNGGPYNAIYLEYYYFSHPF